MTITNVDLKAIRENFFLPGIGGAIICSTALLILIAIEHALFLLGGAIFEGSYNFLAETLSLIKWVMVAGILCSGGIAMCYPIVLGAVRMNLLFYDLWQIIKFSSATKASVDSAVKENNWDKISLIGAYAYDKAVRNYAIKKAFENEKWDALTKMCRNINDSETAKRLIKMALEKKKWLIVRSIAQTPRRPSRLAMKLLENAKVSDVDAALEDNDWETIDTISYVSRPSVQKHVIDIAAKSGKWDIVSRLGMGENGEISKYAYKVANDYGMTEIANMIKDERLSR